MSHFVTMMLNISFFNGPKVVVCAGVNQYQPWGALVVGALSYLIYLPIAKILIVFKSNAEF